MTRIPDQPKRLRLVPISKLTNAPKWQLETMRALQEPLFLWFTAGQGRITLGGSTRGFHPHNAIFIPPGTMYGFQSVTRAQGVALHMGDPKGLDLPDAPLHMRLRESTQHSEVAQIIDAIQRELEGGQAYAERAARHQIGLLAIWLERQRSSAGDDSPRGLSSRNANERLTARYAALLERQFGSALNVSDYAQALGVTPTHLTRACRASCGRSALQLLQERRLFEARRLLTETDVPVQDIARNLGYSTPGYFSRAFAARTGKPPSAYRKGRGA
ncbi:MAG: AraC family transcriptional regulator [Roseibaca calidilacus]|uniref:AraC family transcriptional regulator n=1 Tax=Roseibaca calidilacus TaxID=1666912 RepID=A0A0P7W569_9RHOB|nr:helix-turn-helix domain-containing protein [Roseibaca calidilacus]KPP91859.1 MAG: AraC family transcriptional regulator [Roseibaca calidilacus]CUX82395.1 AraC-type DNA-binding protein [Roseibaca calidilacus]